MDEQKFNELIKLQKYDSEAKYDFCCFCLAVIKRRLSFRGEMKDIESLSHSILEYFLSHLPKGHIKFPWEYLNKSVDHYLSTRKRKAKRTVIYHNDLSYIKEAVYEQRFDQLEKIEIFNSLVKYLGEENARIFYMVKIDGAKEKDVAKLFDLSYETIRQRISRSKEKLEKIFSEYVTKHN